MHPLFLIVYAVDYIRTISVHISKTRHTTNTSPWSHIRFEQGQPMTQFLRRLSPCWNEDANNIPNDVVSALPSKRRLTPLSIMVCNTISEVRWFTILKVLFDPDRQWPLYPASVYQDIANLAPWQRVAVLIHWPDHAWLQSSISTKHLYSMATPTSWQRVALTLNIAPGLNNGSTVSCPCEIQSVWTTTNTSPWRKPLKYITRKNNSLAGTGTTQTALLPPFWMPSMKRWTWMTLSNNSPTFLSSLNTMTCVPCSGISVISLTAHLVFILIGNFTSTSCRAQNQSMFDPTQ